ncbi:MAG: HesA/MoeB/ThiF family protein [Desulfovibrio sp.]
MPQAPTSFKEHCRKVKLGSTFLKVIPTSFIDQNSAERADFHNLEIELLSHGFVPEHYLRNIGTYTIPQQLQLVQSKACIAGLGGLGGYVAELLVRAGVGRIHGADHDVFEASNLNRQVHCTFESLYSSKAHALKERIMTISKGSDFTTSNLFLTRENLPDFLELKTGYADVVLDCYGELGGRAEVAAQAAKKNIPLVTAGIAGRSGYVATVMPGQPTPADFLGAGAGAEKVMGTPAPAVTMAASLQVDQALSILCGEKPSLAGKMYLFDMSNMNVEIITL